ncbi:MAG: hypothetical protein ACYCZR_03260 [Burkholderiales bacterium]
MNPVPPRLPEIHRQEAFTRDLDSPLAGLFLSAVVDVGMAENHKRALSLASFAGATGIRRPAPDNRIHGMPLKTCVGILYTSRHEEIDRLANPGKEITYSMEYELFFAME